MAPLNLSNFFLKRLQKLILPVLLLKILLLSRHRSRTRLLVGVHGGSGIECVGEVQLVVGELRLGGEGRQYCIIDLRDFQIQNKKINPHKELLKTTLSKNDEEKGVK